MADDRSTSFPFAGLAVVALFLGTTFLGPQGFELLRQAETDTAKRPHRVEPPVDARLWEDPLAALARYRERCSDAASTAAQRSSPGCRPPSDGSGLKELFGDNPKDLTIIAAMLPGASLIGAEETRRRTRYAVLGGLNAEGYIPDDSEHMRLMRVRRCERFADCAEKEGVGPLVVGSRSGAWMELHAGQLQKSISAALEKFKKPEIATIDLVYETLTSRAAGTSDRRRNVAVLWIDDTAVGRRWLSTLAMLLADVAPGGDGVRLRILGPNGSDPLVAALDDDLGNLQKEAEGLKAPAARRNFQRNWQMLAKLHLISPESTAPAEQLRREARLSPCPPVAAGEGEDCLEEAFRTRLTGILSTLEGRRDAGQGIPAAHQAPFFVRTIAPDDVLIDLLAAELCARGFADSVSERVALFGEWDSVYARTFAEALNGKPKDGCNGKRIKVEFYPYLRGLDGAGLDGASKQVRLVRSGDKPAGERKDSQIEWPEGRDQRDYVRRIVKEITDRVSRLSFETEVKAVGMIGRDVHDKLVLAQALRAAFPDRVLFTTDLDARLLHPDVTGYTRNIIVASSLPLTMHTDSKDHLQGGIPPFRDSYQTATFLGARYAVADDARQVKLLGAIKDELAKPRLFEIGLHDKVELGTRLSRNAEHGRRVTSAVLVAIVLLGLGAVVAFSRFVPAMSAARLWLYRHKPAEAHFDTASKVVSGLEVGAFGFAVGVVIELCAPGSTGFSGAFLLGMTAAACFWAFLYPGVRALSPGKTGDGSSRAWRWLKFGLRVAFFAWLAWGLVEMWDAAPIEDLREPFAPFSGVSSWPGQLLRTLMIVLFACFLDYAWCRSVDDCRRIDHEYFGAKDPPPVPPPTQGWWRRKLTAWRGRWSRLKGLRLLEVRRLVYVRLWRFYRSVGNATIWLWQPVVVRSDGSIDGARLWREYRKRLRNWPRFGRIMLWWWGVALLIGFGFQVAGAPLVEVPARGIGDRDLFLFTLVLAGSVLIFLFVLVADATVLTWRVVSVMKEGRTSYPWATVDRFAAELGPELRRQAAEPIAARIIDRDGPPAAATEGHAALYGYGSVAAPPLRHGRNSLLDDWIDARLIAEHTAAIGPLIVFPFILLGLVVVARSPLFDNWAIGGDQLAAVIGYVLWAVAMAAMLNIGAEMTRRKALTGMEADLLWLKGAGPDYAKLAERFPDLIAQVRNLRQGAFAPFFEQPLVQAILVPLGGAGGVQLVEYLMFARSQ
jgi:hypothetical protein